MSMKKHIGNYVTVLMGAGFARLFMFMASIIIARTLGKSLYGQFSLFYIAFTIVALFPQAFDTTYIRYAKNLGPNESKAEYLRINILLKIGYSLLILCLSIPIISWLPGSTPGELSPVFLYALGAVGGAGLCFSYSMSSHFQEQGRFMWSTLVETSYCLLIFFGVGSMYLSGFLTGLVQVFALYIFVAIGGGLIFLFLLLRITGPLRLFHRQQAVNFFSLGKWVFFTGLVMYLFPRLDVIFLSKYVSYADIGIYAAANSLVMLLALFSRSLNKVVLPKAMKEAINSPANFRRFSMEVLASSGLIVFVSLCLFFVAKPAIHIIYGPEFASSASIFRVLLIGNLISMLYLPYSFVFYALAEARFRFYLECTKVVLALVLLLVLIPYFGLIGAAWAIAITMAVNAVWSYLILRQKIAKHFSAQENLGTSGQVFQAEKEVR